MSMELFIGALDLSPYIRRTDFGEVVLWGVPTDIIVSFGATRYSQANRFNPIRYPVYTRIDNEYGAFLATCNIQPRLSNAVRLHFFSPHYGDSISLWCIHTEEDYQQYITNLRYVKVRVLALRSKK